MVVLHDHWLSNFLLRYMCTSHRVTGVTPCQLFLKRNLRNKFSLLKPSPEREMGQKQQKQQTRSENMKTKRTDVWHYCPCS